MEVKCLLLMEPHLEKLKKDKFNIAIEGKYLTGFFVLFIPPSMSYYHKLKRAQSSSFPLLSSSLPEE